MKYLLLKEWIVNRSVIISIIILMLISSFIMSEGQNYFPIYLAIGFGCVYPFSSGMTESNNKSDILINSLPVNRKDIVTSKYLASLLIGSLLIIIMATINLVIPSFNNNSLHEMVISISASGFFISIYFPLLFFILPRFMLICGKNKT